MLCESKGIFARKNFLMSGNARVYNAAAST